ncbi:MAG: hypothetical protein AAGJ81_06225 [Verrucomicrobiota bacterium]
MRRIVFIGALAGLLFGHTANAVLQLQINPFTNEFALVGSDFVDAGFAPRTVSWEFALSNDPDPLPQVIIYENDLAFSLFEGESESVEINLRVNSGTPYFFFSIRGTGLPTTATGLGFFQSYGALSATNQDLLESAIGNTMPVFFNGNGGSANPISVVQVPEAATAGLFFGLFAASGVLLRRRRSRRE